MYEGIRRPVEIFRALDGPARRDSNQRYTEQEQKILNDYFHDIHGVFMKCFSSFVFETFIDSDDTVRLQAMLQELIKVKKLIQRGIDID